MISLFKLVLLGIIYSLQSVLHIIRREPRTEMELIALRRRRLRDINAKDEVRISKLN